MRKLGNHGFALMEVLMILFVFLIFLTSLLSSAKFRNRAELIRIEKMEASYIADAAVNLMVGEVLKEGTSFLEDGVEPKETMFVFEAENGKEELRVPVVLWTERKGSELKVYAEVTIGKKTVSASAELHYKEEKAVATRANAVIATASSAEDIEFSDRPKIRGRWIVVERNGV